MKKISGKRLQIKAAKIGMLAAVHGRGDTYLPDVCLLTDITKTLYSAIAVSNCCGGPSDANGNCRTYTPSHNCG